MTSRVSRISATEIGVRWRFAAAPARVFAALTTPEQLRGWMSAAGREMVECHVDLRVGGGFRYVFRAGTGRTFAMFGTFREVVPDRRIIRTEAYDGYAWDPLIVTTVLNADGRGTALAMTICYAAAQICDTDFPNVEAGTTEGFTRLEQSLKATDPG
jgi:uncharacterized protein YndB with AHSA1/START domain